MQHHIVYWKYGRREIDVDDGGLDDLRRQDRRHEVYIEFIDGIRRAVDW